MKLPDIAIVTACLRCGTSPSDTGRYCLRLNSLRLYSSGTSFQPRLFLAAAGFFVRQSPLAAGLRTDQNGAIHGSTDGKSIEVSCFVACPQITALLKSNRPQPPNNQKNEEQQ